MVPKPPWYIKTVQRICQYNDLLKRIKWLRLEIEFAGPKTTAAYSLAPGNAGPGDTVGQLAERTVGLQKELVEKEQELKLLDLVLNLLNERDRMIVSLKYVEGNKDHYVMLQLRKKNYRARSQDTYYRWKDDAVRELAKIMGEFKE